MEKLNRERLTYEIHKLKRKRIELATKQHFKKESSLNEIKSVKKVELEKLELEIERIDEMLVPYIKALNELSFKYLVEYEGDFLDSNNDLFSKKHSEVLTLEADCSIDTVKNGWNFNLPQISKLLTEVADFLIACRYSNFKVINVKRL